MEASNVDQVQTTNFLRSKGSSGPLRLAADVCLVWLWGLLPVGDGENYFQREKGTLLGAHTSSSTNSNHGGAMA